MTIQLPTYEQLFDFVDELAEQLSVEQKQRLIERLRAVKEQQNPLKTLRVFNTGNFPKEMTLRREDEYGDDDR